MTHFDFDEWTDPALGGSKKWLKYKGRDIIPLWVADMDFKSPPAVIEALQARVAHGIFGYGSPPEELTATIVDHLWRHLHWRVQPNWLIWLPGLVTGLNLACRSTGQPGDAVVTIVPAYPPFLTAPGFADRHLVTSMMVFDGRLWQFDPDELQQCMPSNGSLFLLCNPQNPTGRVFGRDELLQIADICQRHDLILCSDEIHCDLILEPDCRHIPIASLAPEIADRTITLMAPSKTYNLPGLGCSFAVISNTAIRRRFKQSMAGIVPHVNVMGFTAALAAYQHGNAWLADLLRYLRGNRDRVYDAVNHMQGLKMGMVQGTYLAWIDARDCSHSAADPHEWFESAGVGLSNGADFGLPGYVRLNFGCRRQLLDTALNRMARQVSGIT